MKMRPLRAHTDDARPFRPTAGPALALVLAFALFVAAACGSSTADTITATADSTDEAMESDSMDSDSMESTDDHDADHAADDEHDTDEHGEHDADAAHDDMGGHAHGEAMDVSADLPTPSLTLDVVEDPKSGWNIHAVPTNHTISAMSASTDHVDGEGHMHLYVDGSRIGRIYNEWVHIGDLAPGDHEIRVELSANSHAALAVDGEVIDQTVTITQPESGDNHGGHGHSMAMDVSALDPAPSLTLEVFEDPKSGWNVHAVPTHHRLSPESASTGHVDGEGHMHLYVDGEKVTRLYGEWHHLSGLTGGDHDIRVELSANSHEALAIGDTVIDQTVTVTETRNPAADDAHSDAEHGDSEHGDEHDDAEHADEGETDGHAHSHETTADGSDLLGDVDATITLMVMDGAISGDTGRQKVEHGTMVGIVVSSNVTDEVHLHGYDLLRPVGPDTNAVIVFEADIPGLFEVELETAGELLFELQVS